MTMFVTLLILSMLNIVFSEESKSNQVLIVHKIAEMDKADAVHHFLDLMLEQLLVDIYRMGLVVTTIGYGDSFSTPNLSKFRKDYTNTIFSMMIGVFLFRFNQASLYRYINLLVTDPLSI
jgi:hypothetical protein